MNQPPMPTPPAKGDLERRLAIVLNVCTWASAAIISAGLIWLIAVQPGQRPALATFDTAAATPTTSLLRPPYGPLTLVVVGVLLLVATPALRVAFLLISFLAARDRLYVALSAVVLVILTLGMLGIVH